MFFFKVVKTNTKKKERLEKPKKEKLLFLILENKGDRKIVYKTKIPTEYREKGMHTFFKFSVNPIHPF